MSKEIIVLAIGGNALTTSSRTFNSQFGKLKNSIAEIAKLAKVGHHIVITHGNGPQVGDALLRNESARKLVPPLPLYACVAGTQGVLGAMIQAALHEILGKRFKVASLITKVTVSETDPSFNHPVKPIGIAVTKGEMVKIKKAEPSAYFTETKPGLFRRIVPSPEPLSILELNAIKNLIQDNHIVIACGGGGVPVMEGKKNQFVEAVIDKDLSSELLATGIGAKKFVILTKVDGVYTNFRSKKRKLLRKIQADKLNEMLEEGFFEEGSMAPKVKAAARFAVNTGNPAIIAALGNVTKAVNLRSGTLVYH